jgi:hypothetical protein
VTDPDAAARDEPTGDLDKKSEEEVLTLLQRLEQGVQEGDRDGDARPEGPPPARPHGHAGEGRADRQAMKFLPAHLAQRRSATACARS